MPAYELHRKVGLFTSLAITILLCILFYKYMPIENWKLFLVWPVAVFYSNVPDLDHHMGKLRKKTLTFIFSAMGLSAIIFFFVNVAVFISLLTVIGLLGLGLLKVKHRGPMHQYWFITIAALPLVFLHWMLFIVGLFAAGSHIFVDRFVSATKSFLKTFKGVKAA